MQPSSARPPRGERATLAGRAFAPYARAARAPPPPRAQRPGRLDALTVHLKVTYRKVNPALPEANDEPPRRVLTHPSVPEANNGYDNELGDLIVSIADEITAPDGTRYEVLGHLGRGTFGQVLKVRTSDNQVMALKVIRNRHAYRKQAETEVELLRRLRLPDKSSDEFVNGKGHGSASVDARSLVVQLHAHFAFRDHLCIVFEQLGVNLLQLLQQKHYQGLGISLIRYFTKQLLKALQLLREMSICHCDLKPENILLQNLHSPAIKLIDFGSACYVSNRMHTYIQSRFYRSPEVLLGSNYDMAIDTWSLGAIVGELFLGLPLFPGESEYNQMARIVSMRGLPPDDFLDNAPLANKFFMRSAQRSEQSNSNWSLKPEEVFLREYGGSPCRNKQYFKFRTLKELIANHPVNNKQTSGEADLMAERMRREALLHFCEGLLQWSPSERWTPYQALHHPFITGDAFDGHFDCPVEGRLRAEIPSTSSASPVATGACAGPNGLECASPLPLTRSEHLSAAPATAPNGGRRDSGSPAAQVHPPPSGPRPPPHPPPPPPPLPVGAPPTQLQAQVATPAAAQMWHPPASQLIAVPVGPPPAMVIAGSPSQLHFSGNSSPPGHYAMSPPEHYPYSISPPQCTLSPTSMHTLAMMGSSPHCSYCMGQQMYVQPLGEYGLQMAVSPPARPMNHRLAGLGECAQCQMYGPGEVNDADGRLYCTRCWKEWDQAHSTAYLQPQGTPPVDGGYHYPPPAFYAPQAQAHMGHTHLHPQHYSSQHFYAHAPLSHLAPPMRLGVSVGSLPEGTPPYESKVGSPPSHPQRMSGRQRSPDLAESKIGSPPSHPQRMSGRQRSPDLTVHARHPVYASSLDSPHPPPSPSSCRDRRRSASRDSTASEPACEHGSATSSAGDGDLHLSFNDLFVQ